MRMIFRTTVSEINRMLRASGFWLAVALILVILLTATAYKEDEDGTTYTVLSMVLQYNKGQIGQMGLCVQTLFSTVVRGNLPMYGPLLAAMAFAGGLCEERKYGVRRYILMRNGKSAHVCSKALSAIITSGLVFFVAGCLFLLFLYWRYPLKSAQDMETFRYWLEFQSVAPNGEPILLFEWLGEHAYSVLQLLGLFLYGMFCGVIGYICTVFFSNVYLAVCIPFFFGYIYYSITQALMARAIEGSISWDMYNSINSYVSPEGYMYFWRMTDSFGANMVCLIILWAIAIGIHMLHIYKATDCGVK